MNERNMACHRLRELIFDLAGGAVLDLLYPFLPNLYL